jgi:hypothetical protein
MKEKSKQEGKCVRRACAELEQSGGSNKYQILWHKIDDEAQVCAVGVSVSPLLMSGVVE